MVKNCEKWLKMVNDFSGEWGLQKLKFHHFFIGFICPLVIILKQNLVINADSEDVKKQLNMCFNSTKHNLLK